MTPTATSNAEIKVLITGIIEDLKIIQQSMKELTGCYQGFVVEYERRHATLENATSAAHNRIDMQAKEVDQLRESMKKLESAIHPLITQSKIIGWVASVLGVSVIALIWGLITGTVTLVIP